MEQGIGALAVATVKAACHVMNEQYQPDRWGFSYRGLGTSRVICAIERLIEVGTNDGFAWVKREGVAPQDEPDKAFLRAFELWGGNVQPSAVEEAVKEAPSAMPKQISRPTAPPISSAMPEQRYDGPKPWFNDSNADIQPLAVPDPPQEPEWFGRACGWWIKNKKGENWGEMTWQEAVRIELENPGGRNQPLGYARWCIENRSFSVQPGTPPDKEQQWRRAHYTFVERAKGALIWWSKAKDQMSESGGDPIPAGERPENQEVPF